MLRFTFVFILFLLGSLGPQALMAATPSPLPTMPSSGAASTPSVSVPPALKPAVKSAAAPAAVSKVETAPTDKPTAASSSEGEVSADDPYTVHGVQVDVSADTSMKARDKAFTIGQQTAFVAMAKNLSGSDTVKSVDPEKVAKLVKSFEVETERASGTRYTATLTYHFKPQATAALLGKDSGEINDDPYNRPKKPDGIQALSATTMPPERILVLPILRAPDHSVLWEEKTPWHLAWNNVLSDRPQPDLVVAEGTLEDVGAITSGEALAGLNIPLTRIMRKYQARGVIVAVLLASAAPLQPNQNLSMQLARFDSYGKMLSTIAVALPAQPNRKEIEWLQGGVSNAISAWRDSVAKAAQQQPQYGIAQPAMPTNTAPGQFMRVNLTVPFANMEEWSAKREVLQSIPGMAAVEVKTMNRYRAIVQIDYTGAQSQLDQALSTRNMQIMPTNPPDGTYMLSSTGQPPIAAPNQPIFTTVYPSAQPQQMQPQQMQQQPIPGQPHIQPTGQPEVLQEDQEDPNQRFQ